MSFAGLLDKYTAFAEFVKTAVVCRIVAGQSLKNPGFMRLCALKRAGVPLKHQLEIGGFGYDFRGQI